MPSNLDASKNADAPSTAETSLPCVHCGEPTEVHRDSDPKTVYCGTNWPVADSRSTATASPLPRIHCTNDTPSLTEPIIWVHPNPASNPMERWCASWPCMDCTVPPALG